MKLWERILGVAGCLVVCLWLTEGIGAEPVQADPPQRIAERPTPQRPQSLFSTANPNEHPLMPALRWAHQGLPQIEKIKDYSATMVKRERVGGKLGEYEHVFLKIRHEPFSVYMYFLGPEDRRGQEVIYVHNRNDNMIVAHGTGVQRTMFGTV
ncbi:MAG TPA: DUF1571 domain-containing protein, partial [Thermoguttaceae bacterium]|nr:DUF1571 domain-containing protein [Thermoguttaceae bacterium]